MIGEPWFWRERSVAASLIANVVAPAALLYDIAQKLRRRLTTPANAGVPVICVGNATLGGVGKTPFAIMLRGLLADAGIETHFLTRGYGGALRGPVRVEKGHTATEVGDEPLLLSALAPTWVAADRITGARAACKAGAAAIIMDDGFQNPTLKKNLSLLLMNADNPFGNGKVFPAGPLREPATRAIARADAVVFIGAEASAAVDVRGKPIFVARPQLEPPFDAQKIVAFCGIGNPQRFFTMLEAAGFDLAERIAFPDHHPFTPAEIARLKARAGRLGARLVTTQKDMARLSAGDREDIHAARLTLRVDDKESLLDLVLVALKKS